MNTKGVSSHERTASPHLVLPERPEGTEGWSEEELGALVTRNAMIGVQQAKSPQDIGGADERRA